MIYFVIFMYGIINLCILDILKGLFRNLMVNHFVK